MLLKRILTFVIFTASVFPGFAQDQNLEIQTMPTVIALYRNCGNEIKITKPVISATDNVKYVCEGGMVMANVSDPRVITIVPDLAKVTLKIFRDTMLIGKTEFRVRLIPTPTIDLYSDSSLVENLNPKNVRLSKKTRYLTLKAKPDEVLAAYMPYDARYTVKSWKIKLFRETKIIDSLSVTNETIDASRMFSKAKPGDNIYIEVYKVIRKNFLAREEDVKIGTVIKRIPIE